MMATAEDVVAGPAGGLAIVLALRAFVVGMRVVAPGGVPRLVPSEVTGVVVKVDWGSALISIGGDTTGWLAATGGQISWITD